MKKFYLRFFKMILAIIILFQCGNTHAQTVSLNHNGYNRSCIIHLPSGYNAANNYPLVFNLHGYNSAAWQQQLYCQMDAVADTAGFIVAYPDASGGAWDTSFSVSVIDDPGFFNALLDKLITLYSIDITRVYATGLSMGGFMTYRLATETGNRFAAIASVAGPTTDSVLFFGNFAPVIPVMHIHGTSDSNVPYDGTALFNPVDSTIQYFISHNHCNTTPVVNNLPDLNTSDSCNITTYCYSCTDSNEVLFYKVYGGGHSWPGGLFAIPQLGNMNLDINGSSHIWNFFKRHQRQIVVQGIGKINEPLAVKIYPNPASGILYVELPREIFSETAVVEITDMTGKLLQKTVVDTIRQILDIQGFDRGMYIMRAACQGKIFQSRFTVIE